MNIDFLFNISESQKHFVSGSFYVIIYTEVIYMNTVEILVVIMAVLLFACLVVVLHKTGGGTNK